MTATFDNIVIMGDILRPWRGGDQATSGAFRNVQWLYHIIKAAVRKLNIPVYALDWNRHSIAIDYKLFDIAAYYYCRGMEINVNNWSELAMGKEPCKFLGDQLNRHLSSSLVVGYEMSSLQIETLASMNVLYMDLALHPVRFAPDILHGVRTNSSSLHQKLQFCHLDSSIIYESAANLMSKVSRIAQTLDIPMGTGLIIGQVWTDRAVAKPGGGFYKLDNFFEQIRDIVHSHSAVIYKPHPYEAVSGEKSRFTDVFKTIATTTLNYYMLINQPTISSVWGLNSSGLYEAQFFGKKPNYLIAPQYSWCDDKNGNEIQEGEFLTVGDVWTTSGFWEYLLAAHKNVSINKDSVVRNRLRSSMNTDWGFDQIDRNIIKL